MKMSTPQIETSIKLGVRRGAIYAILRGAILFFYALIIPQMRLTLAIEMILLASCIVGIHFKSRIASTFLLAYSILVTVLSLLEAGVIGVFSLAILMAFIVSFYEAMMATYRYHMVPNQGVQGTPANAGAPDA